MQDWPHLEIVVVDDCSTDGSWDVLEELASRDDRIRVIRHEVNKGYPAALNTIVSHAQGEFVAFFDDDDDNVPDRLRAQVERIEAYERGTGAQLVFCYSNRAVVHGGETKPHHIAKAIGRVPREPSGPMVADFILGIDADPGYTWGRFGSCTLMVRRSTLDAVGPFDETFRRSAEWDMAIRGAQMGAHFIAVDRPLITQHKTATADKAGTIPLRYALKLRDKHRDYLKARGLYRASRLIAHSNFHGNGQRKWRARGFRALAYLTAPKLIGGFLARRKAARTR